MQRRRFIQGLAALSAYSTLAHAQSNDRKAIEDMQKNWKSLLAPGTPDVAMAPPLKLGKEEWKKRLSAPAYDVLREEGTEYAGTSPLNAEHRAGVFACAGCGLPLFTSAMKFDSGTGWPSFFTTIPGVFSHSNDYKLVLQRNEYHCVKCGGHHGHVFDDGPAPTRQRWCNNGVALHFIPKTGKS